MLPDITNKIMERQLSIINIPSYSYMSIAAKKLKEICTAIINVPSPFVLLYVLLKERLLH